VRADDEIDVITRRVDVFSRAQPEDKIAIVHSFQRMQEVVGMTGDGVNDAPALKAADIGVAMGLAGTDVAKGAADLVLIDDNFVTIVAAIEEGRKIYGNLQKFVSFLLGTNIGEVWYLATAIIVGMPVPLMALQIIFLNLMSDGCPAVALSREPADPACMKVPPRPKKANIMTLDWWRYGNLPHCFFEALGVLGALSTGLTCFTGKCLTTDIAGLCDNIEFEHRQFPVFCRCDRYDFHATGKWDTMVEWFEPNPGFDYEPLKAWYAKNDHMDYSGPSPGKWQTRIFESVTLSREEAFAAVKEEEFFSAFENTDDYVTTMLADKTVYEPTLMAMYAKEGYQEQACNALGTLKGRTFSFVAAVYCEMMRAYTVRCAPGTGQYPQWMWEVLNRNKWMHLACTISFWSTLAVTVIPKVTDGFHTHPLPFAAYICSICFPVGNLICDELVPKPLYIMKLNAQGGMETVEKREARMAAARGQAMPSGGGGGPAPSSGGGGVAPVASRGAPASKE
jgi:hypothetical protein